MTQRSQIKLTLLPVPRWIICILVFASVGIWMVPPISQDPHYHNFADQRFLLGVAHCHNVLSNVPFLLGSIVGLFRVRSWNPSPQKNQWRFFFLAIGFVTFGSAYYHHMPNNLSLFWDRLPMSCGFAALSALFFGDRFPRFNPTKLFSGLLFLNLVAVFYWLYTETLHRGDLRLYILVQYLPMILIPLTLLGYPKSPSQDRPYWLLLLGYSLAKICEVADVPLYLLLKILSGHTLKHLLAAATLLGFALLIPQPPTREPQIPPNHMIQKEKHRN